jgi:hypothetical protein
METLPHMQILLQATGLYVWSSARGRVFSVDHYGNVSVATPLVAEFLR